jgi:uncharacterized membrane protein YgdD (TMEM256/DUF423 family)
MRKSILVLAALASLAGGASVILLAVAAHGPAGPLLQTGANLLLPHALATLGAVLAGLAAPQSCPWFLAAGWLLLLGSTIFCADLAFRALAETRAFPMAAPLGGTLMILGWLQFTAGWLNVLLTKPRTEL